MGDSENNDTNTEARWRNYQHLVWTQQQIQLQIQQQQHHQQQRQMQNPNPKMNGMEVENGTNGGASNGHPLLSTPLPEKSLEDKSKGEGMDPWDNFDAQAAFLGPTLWDKRLPYDGQDFKLEYVDLEEFLTENGIPVDSQPQPDNNYMKNGQIPSGNLAENPVPTANGGIISEQINNCDCSPTAEGGFVYSPHNSMMGAYGPGPSRNPQSQTHMNGSPNQPNMLGGSPTINQSDLSRSPSPCGSSISRSSSDSTTPSMHHLQHLDSEQNEDMAMGTPGHDFDPRTRIFTEDELKPQPMIKKSKKQVQSHMNTFVPDEAKDAKYWARRRKNNMAAKRSRDARRVKENQIAMRACFLEKENSVLKSEIDRIQKENMLLKEQLSCCRREH